MAAITTESTSAPLHIVRLDGVHCAPPEITVSHSYFEVPNATSSEIPSLIKDANIIITSRVPLTRYHLSREVSPKLQMVAIMAIGYDTIDMNACAERGIIVCNVPAASNESVAEHAISLFMAVRRRVVRLHSKTAEGVEWPFRGTLLAEFGGLPGTWKEEVVGIIGAGELGKSIDV